MPAQSKSSQQCPVACDVDDPRNSAGIFIDMAKSGSIKLNAGIAGGNIDAEFNVFDGLFEIEGSEIISQGYALAELSEFMGVEDIT